MINKNLQAPKWTAADRARHKSIRHEFMNRPTQEQLQATGDYESMKSGAYFLVRVLLHDLKKSRQEAGLTLAAVSKLTGIDQATLSRLENGRVPNPTVDTLWRLASAVGRRLILTHTKAPSRARRNHKVPVNRDSA